METTPLKGEVIHLSNIQTVGAKEYKKRDFAIRTEDGQYSQDIGFELFGDKVDDLSPFLKVGAVVQVSYNIKGNEYNGRYYVKLSAWRIETIKKAPGTATSTPSAPPQPLNTEDLPF